MRRRASGSDQRVVALLVVATTSMCLFDLYRLITLTAG